MKDEKTENTQDQNEVKLERLVMWESDDESMTVKQLKDLIKDWSEIDPNTGEPCEVWIETGEGVSSPVTAVYPLNKRKLDDKFYADVILESDAFST